MTEPTDSGKATEPSPNPSPANVEISIDKKAKKAGEKLLRAQKKQEIYNNFATPLIGTFLNLPEEPVLIRCPGCGIEEMSQVENDLKWWAIEINRILGCLFVMFCCCCCLDYKIPCRQSDRNHYCRNCGCYFGRALKVAPHKPKTRKP